MPSTAHTKASTDAIQLIPYAKAMQNLMHAEPASKTETLLKPLAKTLTLKEEFHGTTIGIAITQTDCEISEILTDNLSIPLNDLIELLKDDQLTETYGIAPMRITQHKDGKLVDSLLWMLLFTPETHSSRKPTVTSPQVDPCVHNVSYRLDIEIILADDEYSRSFVYQVSTVNMPMFSLVNDLFEYDLSDDLEEEDLNDMFPNDPDIFRYGEDENDETGYLVPYYNKFGEKIVCAYRRPEDILNHVVSARVIRCDMTIR